jgi:hypothetical protein
MKSLAATSRRLLTVAALFVAAAAPALAADQPAQRLAMVYTKATDVASKPVAASTARHAQADQTVAMTRRAQTSRSSAMRDSDGSRFVYDSCGCSNE